MSVKNGPRIMLYFQEAMNDLIKIFEKEHATLGF